MNDNLKYWKQHADINPKFTKPIVGKPYKGTSPNPQYISMCMTDMFGPVGEGWGFNVAAEGFQPLGDELLHWCRLSVWHTDRENTFEAYGQTKALVKKRNGDFMSDEDAPKKSMTDALVKAASYIGIGANIFLGRWDDQKYVQHVEEEFRKKATKKREAKKDSKAKVTAEKIADADAYVEAEKSPDTDKRQADAMEKLAYNAKTGGPDMARQYLGRLKVDDETVFHLIVSDSIKLKAFVEKHSGGDEQGRAEDDAAAVGVTIDANGDPVE